MYGRRTIRLGLLAATMTLVWLVLPGRGRRPEDGWRYIVIHHSATATGNAGQFHRHHLLHGLGGLAYHFVIDNGQGGADGTIETGFRWTAQESGTACSWRATDINRYGIAICLVGDFERTSPTAAQMRALTRLVTGLRQQYHIPADRVLGHREAMRDNSPMSFETTLCPGRLFDLAAFRASLGPSEGTGQGPIDRP